MTNDELLTCIDRFGANANQWRRRFLGVLPEAARRELHRKRRLSGPAELASRKCGVSHQVVTRVLHLDQKLVAFPRLRALFEQGAVGWAKLEAIVGEVTADDEVYWVEAVQRNTRSKLLLLVQEREEARDAAVTGSSLRPLPAAARESSAPRSSALAESLAEGGAHSLAEGGGECAARSSRGTEGAPGDDDAALPTDVRFAAGSAAPAAASAAAPPAASAAASTAASATGSASSRRPVTALECSLLVAERFLTMTQRVGGPRADGRGPSIDERLTYLLDHFAPEADARVRYQEVVNFDEARGTRTVATRFGAVPVEVTDLEGKVSLGATVDLAAERLTAREAAEAYVTRRRARGLPPGRLIPARVRRYLALRDQGFCAVPDCRRRATHIHHLDRFILHPEPWPDRLASYCSVHGDLAHTGSLRDEGGEVSAVHVGLPRPPTTPDEAARERVDRKVRRHGRRRCAEERPPDDFFDEPDADPRALLEDADEYQSDHAESDHAETDHPGTDHPGTDLFAGEAGKAGTDGGPGEGA